MSGEMPMDEALPEGARSVFGGMAVPPEVFGKRAIARLAKSAHAAGHRLRGERENFCVGTPKGDHGHHWDRPCTGERRLP